MKVFLKKNFKNDSVSLNKGAEGWIYCCLLHNDSYLVQFGEKLVEVARTEVSFSKVEEPIPAV